MAGDWAVLWEFAGADDDVPASDPLQAAAMAIIGMSM